MRRLSRSFFTKRSLIVAKKLLGCFLVRRIGKKLLIGRIVETEAYPGPSDRASHAFDGKVTARNKIEYEKGGYVYIYLVYGMYWQLNITTGRAGYPECVLIRALEVSDKQNATRDKKRKTQNRNIISMSRVTFHMSPNVANGPGKLCRWLKLGKSFYGENMARSKRLWVATDGSRIPPRAIAKGPRIGIDYAGPHYAKKPWRFWIKANPCISR